MGPNSRYEVDRYLLRERLGAGGNGEVYRAWDPVLGRHVAVKLLRASVVASEDDWFRIAREARAAGSLRHSAIIPIYDVRRSRDGRPFLVMELVEGKTLELLRLEGAPRGLILRAVRDVADGLRLAHRHRLLHLDVKPGNILVREGDGGAVLVDFGLARRIRVADETSIGFSETASCVTGWGLHGTPPYLAPEQVDRGTPSPATDQFQLAVTAFEALVGERPFQGSSVRSLFDAIATRPQPPPSSFLADLPSAVDRVFERALAKDPADRFPDVVAFADALAEAVPPDAQARRVRAPTDAGAVSPPSPAAHGARPSLTGSRSSGTPRRSARWLLALVAGLAALGGTVLVLALPGDRSSDAAARPPASPTLAEPDSSLACPPLRVSGGGEQARDRWLGSAAAQLACRRAQAFLGLGSDRTVWPSQLFGLSPGVRQLEGEVDLTSRKAIRGMVEAAAEHPARLGGSVRPLERPGRFEVSLEVRGDDDRPEGAGVGRGTLWQATFRAVDALGAAGALGPEVDPSAEAARWFGADDAEQARFSIWLEQAVRTGAGVEEVCETLRTDPDPRVEVTRRLESARCRAWTGEGLVDEASPLPELGELPDEALARMAVLLVKDDPGAFDGLLDALAAARRRHPGRPAQARLWAAEAYVRLFSDEPTSRDAARTALLRAVNLAPRELTLDAWSLLPRIAPSQPEALVYARAFARWMPGSHTAWCGLAQLLEDPEDADEQREAFRRCHLLAPAVPVASLRYADALIDDGLLVEARRLATDLDDDGRGALVQAYVRARLLAQAGGMGAAFRLLRDALGETPVLAETFFTQGDGEVLRFYLELGAVLGEDAAAADLVERFLMAPGGPRVAPYSFYAAGMVATLCLHVSAGELPDCVAAGRDALRSVPAPSEHDGDVLAALEASVRGDAEALRGFLLGLPLDHSLFELSAVVRTLEALGEHDRAIAVDAQHADDVRFAGCHPALVRHAERLAQACRSAEARAVTARLRTCRARADGKAPGLIADVGMSPASCAGGTQ
jgi:serine/threonine protein kinase